MRHQLPKGVTLKRIVDPTPFAESETRKAEEWVLTTEAMNFLALLHRKFERGRQEILRARKERQKELNKGVKPDFLPETASIRNDPSWKVAPIPHDLQRRWVEITGPTDRKKVINALNSGADVFMADFEDSNSPTWHNMLEGQRSLIKAVTGKLTFTSPEGKEYHLNEKTAVLMVRPRGWHLNEKHFLVDGMPMSASLFDFGLAFFHNASNLIAKGSGPYFYLPKLEGHKEARLWNEVFVFAQESLGIPKGTIRATVLVETILATFEMEEILYELREHSAGLNAGRWDYLFSILKKLGRHELPLMPDRGAITMELPFMRDYNRLLVQICHSRGASAIGGMSAYIPSRKDPAVNETALKKVRDDKLRELKLGFDGTWVAHPDLVPFVRIIFSEGLGNRDNQIATPPERCKITAEALLNFHVADATITERGLRQNISVVLQYLTAWFQGTGAVAIANLMEDAATAEISCAQLWQWLHFKEASLADGRPITKELYDAIANEEMAAISKANGQADAARFNGILKASREVMDGLALGDKRPEFLTLVAYEQLI